MVPREPPDLLAMDLLLPFPFRRFGFFGSRRHHGLGRFGFHVWIWFAPVSFALIWVSSCFHFCLSFLLQLRWFFVSAALWVYLPWNRLAEASAFFVVVHRSKLPLSAPSSFSCF